MLKKKKTRFFNKDGGHKHTVSLKEKWKFLQEFIFFRRKPPKPPFSHVVSPEEALSTFKNCCDQDSITWLGHAAFTFSIDQKRFLADPFLSKYASPIPKIGPHRYVESPLSLEQIGDIDIILLSHNHYDHFDIQTLKRIKNKGSVAVVVPQGLGKKIRALGYKRIYELKWGDVCEIKSLRIHATPTVHRSGRTLFDSNKTCWCGFVIENKEKKIYFGGDSAYHPSLFKEIGQQYGPFDIAMVGIGAYEPRNILKIHHANPEEAVIMAQELRSKAIIGMHWGTIILSSEPPLEPIDLFVKAARKKGFTESQIWNMRIGETRILS